MKLLSFKKKPSLTKSQSCPDKLKNLKEQKEQSKNGANYDVSTIKSYHPQKEDNSNMINNENEDITFNYFDYDEDQESTYSREERLFFSIWRNNKIKRCIFHHLEIFNLMNNVNDPITLDQLHSIESGKLRDYCKMVKIEKNEKIELQCMPIPNHIEKLIFSNEFDKPIKVGTIPSSVVEIEFGEKFNQVLKQGQLPPSLQTLKFGKRFNQMVTNSSGELPTSLTTLIFGSNFDQIILKNFIPPNVSTLIFGLNFDQPLSPGYIPSSVTRLEFQENFNQPLTVGTIPKNVKHLKIYSKFPLIQGAIPPSCTTLYYGGDCSQGTKNIPDSVKSLHFLQSINCNDLIARERALSKTSSSISLDISSTTSGISSSSNSNGGNNGEKIIYLQPESICKSVTDLTIELNHGPPHKKYLPMNSITKLSLGINEFKKPLKSTYIPSGCTSLLLNIGPDYKFQQLLAKSIPSSVTSLQFGPNFNLIIMPNSLPIHLRSIDFGDGFNQQLLQNSLPTLIDSIKFGKSYNQPIPIFLSNSNYLTSIEFGKSFNQPLIIGNGSGLNNNSYNNNNSNSNNNNNGNVIANLPITLNKLKFSKDSNFKSLLKIESDSMLEEIEFGDQYNQEFVNQCTLGCTHLLSIKFGESFNQPINSLASCSSIKKLIFGNSFNQSISNLPENLTSLSLGTSFSHNLINLPTSLIELKIFNKAFLNNLNSNNNNEKNNNEKNNNENNNNENNNINENDENINNENNNNNKNNNNNNTNSFNDFIKNTTIKRIRVPCLITTLNFIVEKNIIKK
ncbi:hypothetical protein ACTFIU_002786 [Dictyostelium citrinum]